MRRLVLVRHGESLWNAEARIQGEVCDGLSDVGHLQAHAVGPVLASRYPDAALVSSDLRRCVETMRPLADLLEREPGRDPRLRERRFGDWEGRLRAEVAESEPDRWARFRAGEDVVPEVGGESAQQVVDRVTPALRDLLDATPDGGVTIVVTHGGPVWQGSHRLLDLTRPTLAGVDNTSICELVSPREGLLLLDRWNEVGHLPADLRTTMGRRATGRAPSSPPVRG